MTGFAPEWMETVPVPRVGEPGDIHYIVVNNERALRWISSVGAIEVHPFLHTAEDLNRPTAVIFDLDPGEGADLLAACTVAIAIREFLESYHLECFPKVSGAKGIQVYLPLNSEASYAQTEAFARKLAETLARQMPQLIVADMAKLHRRRKVLIDWSQNSPYKTTVAAYSLRATSQLPYVSMPLTWDEVNHHLATRDMSGLYFTVEQAVRRTQLSGDLFEPVLRLRQELPPKLLREWQIESLASITTSIRISRSKTQSARPRSSGQGGRKRFAIRYDGKCFELNLHFEPIVKQWRMQKLLEQESTSAQETGEQEAEYLSQSSRQWWDFGVYELVEGSYDKRGLLLFFSGKRLQGAWSLSSPLNARGEWVFASAGGRIQQSTEHDREQPPIHGRSASVIGKPVAASATTADLSSVPMAEPQFVAPMECDEVQCPEQLPSNRSDWLYEIKWDGHRAIAVKRGGMVGLYTRNGKAPTCRHSHIVEALQNSNLPDCTLDGELVAFDENRVPRFQLLQNSYRNDAPVVYVLFDIVNYQSRDVTGLPLEERKRLLRNVSSDLPPQRVALSEAIEAELGDFLELVRSNELEGVVAKRRDSIYRSGKVSTAWVKYWIGQQTEFVIGGYLREKDPLFDALIAGEYVNGKLVYREKVRHGFTHADKLRLLDMLQPLRIPQCPFSNLPQSKRRGALDTEQMQNCIWAKPQIWCLLRYKERTAAGELREHGLFRGIVEVAA